jgi:peptide/nickel transport system substrate-binding protein
MKRLKLAAAMTAAIITAPPAPANAQSVRAAFDAEWTALDPHFHSFPYNLSVAYHLFDALVAHDANQQVVPRLATAWRTTAPDRWEFTLRPDARFADGTPVTAADVVASVARIKAVRNSPGPLTALVRPIKSIEATGPHALSIVTDGPAPTLLDLLTGVFIVPASLADATVADFASGAAQKGSGAFRFVEYRRGEVLRLARNPAHWGTPAHWAEAEIRVLPNAASREAALVAGDIDFIVNPPTTSVARLASDPRFAVHRATSTRITYIQLHQGNEVKADTTGTNGQNPFADARVRRALSLAIPREAITLRIMDGLATPAGQVIPPGQAGHHDALGVEKQDLETARALLAEAGYPQGFATRLSTPSDRNLNGRRVAEAIAAQLTRIGMRTEVNAVPLNVWLADWRAGKFSMILHGAGPVPVPWTLLPQLAGTKDTASGYGTSNESFFSNPRLDELLRGALSEIEPARRAALLRQGGEIVRAQTAVVPLHHEQALWASRGALVFAARADTLTYLADLRPR